MLVCVTKIALSVLVLLNSASLIGAQLPELYEENALNLARDLKKSVRQELWNVLNRSNFSDLTSEGCSRKVKSALESPLTSAAFEWIVQMYYSSGGLPGGIFSGTTISLGDYDQCLRIGEQFPSTQYCLLTLRMRRSAKYREFNFTAKQRKSTTKWQLNQLNHLLLNDNRHPIAIGLCLPAQCTDYEKQSFGRALPLASHFDARVEYCQSETRTILSLLENIWPLLLFIFLMGAICGLGTFLDFLYGTQFGKDNAQLFERFSVRLLLCFSQISNFEMLFNMGSRTTKAEFQSKKPDRPQVNLNILDGLRVFAIGWIVICHTASYSMMPNLMKISPLGHYPDDFIRTREANWPLSAYLVESYYAVCIFFMLSGILVMYSAKPNHQCGIVFHFIQHTVARYFRLSPSFLVITAVTYFLRYLGSGPLFQQELVQPFTEQCKKYFWANLLLVQNFLPQNARCGSHTWYVAADFHLSVLAFFVVHLIKCRSNWMRGIVLAVGIMAAAIFIQMSLVMMGVAKLFNQIHYFDLSVLFPSRDFELFYYATFNYAGAFFIGVMLGYILSSWDLSLLHKNKLLRFGLLYLSVGILFLLPLTMRHFVYPRNLQPQTHPIVSLILFQLFSFAFCFALGVFIVVSAVNPTLYISRIMSAAILRPIARLVFSIYLTHQMLIWFTVQQTRFPVTINLNSQFALAATVFVGSFICSVVLYTSIECPFVRITKLIFESQPVGGACRKPSFMIWPFSSIHDNTVHKIDKY